MRNFQTRTNQKGHFELGGRFVAFSGRSFRPAFRGHALTLSLHCAKLGKFPKEEKETVYFPANDGGLLQGHLSAFFFLVFPARNQMPRLIPSQSLCLQEGDDELEVPRDVFCLIWPQVGVGP